MNIEISELCPADQQLEGTVKWFDTQRGFGFVSVAGYDADFLLHQNVVQQFGRTSIAENVGVQFRFVATNSGFRVTHLLHLTAAPEEPTDGHEDQPDFVHNQTVPAKVKWFDGKKGYGFVNRFGSSEDIFVGVNVLRQSTFADLNAGEAVRVQIAETAGRKSVYRLYDWNDLAA